MFEVGFSLNTAFNFYVFFDLFRLISRHLSLLCNMCCICYPVIHNAKFYWELLYHILHLDVAVYNMCR